jgi:uncharacterized protein YecT (DUF1311 family)
MRYFIYFTFMIVSPFVESAPYIFNDGKYSFAAETVEECYGKGRYSFDCKQYFDNQSNNRLSTSYGELLSQLIRDKELLIKAQEKWEQFAQAQCVFESAAAKAYANPEKQSQLVYDECMNALKDKRAEYLESIMVGCSACVK